jgi:hypothetical protein
MTACNSKKKKFRTIKYELENAMRANSCECSVVPIGLRGGACMQEIGAAIRESGKTVDVLFLGLGANDLLDKSGNLVDERPADLELRIQELANEALKCGSMCVALVGGDACIWRYQPRWNSFIGLMQRKFTENNVKVVPLTEATQVMQSLQMHADALHFQSTDKNKELMAKATAEWILATWHGEYGEVQIEAEHQKQSESEESRRRGRCYATVVRSVGGAVQERHIAWDGRAYTKEDFQQYYGDAGGNMWDTAPTKPHQAFPPPDSLVPYFRMQEPGWRRGCQAHTGAGGFEHHAAQERRIAWDGRAYTKEDFQQWYGAAGGSMWDLATQ